MLEKRITRRRLISATVLAVAGAGVGLKCSSDKISDLLPSLSLSPPSARAEGLRHLAWVWQFKADGSPDAIAAVLAQNSLGILLKTHDGSTWMSRWDNSMHAVTGPEQVAKLAGYFEGCGVPFHAWHVANGRDPVREAEMCAQVFAAGARSVTVDLEPFEGYWQGTRESALVFGQEFRRRQPNGVMYVTVDPRPWIMRDTPVAEFASFCQGFAPMTYWETFKSRDNVDLYRKFGFPPGEAGVTPEFVLDVTHRILRPYGLPIWPAGESSTADAWSRFISHAENLGMGSVSVWRYGVTHARVWQVLKEMQPGLSTREIPGISRGRGARVANTGICLRVYAGPSKDAEIIAYLVDGTPITLLDGTVEAEGYRWWFVGLGDKKGWVPQGDPSGVPWLVPLPATGVNTIRPPH